ncbi:MAG: hypothetical protein HY820_40215 [Acidobacteria bacterium]|nr:hypothetical protein [Acidobacteriota bacterium]
MSEWASLMNTLNAAALGAFGRPIAYLPLSGEPLNVRAIVQTGRRSEESAPGTCVLLFLRLADLPTPPERGDEARIDGASYKVFEIEADGEGGVTVALRLA